MDYHIDAKNKILGRVATDISLMLQGKKSATFERNRVSTDKVYVTNYESIVVTGKKAILRKSLLNSTWQKIRALFYAKRCAKCFLVTFSRRSASII